MRTLYQDLRYGFRQLGRSPGFAVVAILTLAIGIGANIAMFSVVNAVLLRPLPFEDADRLVIVQQHSKQYGWTTGFSYPDYVDWKQQNQVFEGFAAYTRAQFDLIDGQGASKIDGAMVTANFFSLLKSSAHLGRTFAGADGLANSEQVAVISHDFWRSRLGQAPDVLGRTITVHDKTYMIVGVLPRSFHYPESLGDAQMWTVLRPTSEEWWTNRTNCWLGAVGRLKAGMSMEQAFPLLNALHSHLAETYGTPSSEVLLHGLRDMVVRGVRTTLGILTVIVGFILLIVCANVANLCLARASFRDKEVAVRRALGANRLRLLRQFTTESLLLSLAGGVTGLILTVWTIAVFRVKIAGFVPMADSIRVDPQVLLFGLGVSLLVGVFLGIAPFWFIQRPPLTNVLTERRSASGHHAWLSNALIAGQVAMALILSVGMVLMVRSMTRLSSAETGFNRENLITFKIGTANRDEAQRYQFCQDFLERLGALPQVKGASTDSSMPSSPRGSSAPVTVAGYTSPDGKPVRAVCHNVNSDYFKTLQILILRGRNISSAEHQRKENLVVINQSLAQRFWPDEDPIGRELTFCRKSYRVVGIAADMIQGNVRLDKPNHLFFPFDTIFPSPDLNVVVRATSDPGSVIQQARAILRGIDATLPLYGVSTFKAQMNECISQERFTGAFLTVFASIALLLIVIGIYGVVSYSVTQRTREIGIRMALGARKTTILSMILKQGLVLLAAGSAIGIVGALGLTRFLSSYLYGISATDPVTFVLVPVLLAGVALAACYVPARRAARIDPMVALRYE